MQQAPGKLWLADQPLMLASRSKARRAMLKSAGIPITVVPSNVDEPLLQKEFGASVTASEVAIKLARAKAMDISLKHPPQIVLGSDQTLEFVGRALAKVESRVEARDRLIQMSGRQHQLHSAFCFARDGEVVHSGVQTATISMRTLSEDFIDVYLDTSGNSVLESVAVYEVEALGIQMIEKIEGDWFTVQGLPLRAVIAFLQHQRLLLS